ncbi:hypothetical protein [Streptomyces sp. NPDC052042]|uniref:hypothetical protein n=1 Tax=Streptomyces sp. NPDC052042 TaxID=3365683 RepID=UPI0037D02BFD
MAEAAHRRRTTVALTLAALALTAATGCGAVDKALDCVRTADAIATSADSLQQAVLDAAIDPAQASEALDDIEEELGALGDATGDADLGKAVDHLRTAVDNVRDAIEKGEATPDIAPVAAAAKEIGKICTP